MEQKKKQLRKQVKEALHDMEAAVYKKKCAAIAAHLFQLPCWQKAKVVALTVGRTKKREVHTYPIIEKAWQEKKTVAIARSHFQTRKMTFHTIVHLDQLERRSFHLQEPYATCPLVDINEIDLFIIPGLAFTYAGDRLGYGGGFFDRFLQNVSAPTVALAFSNQIFSDIPTEKHDVSVDYVIGPDGVYT